MRVRLRDSFVKELMAFGNPTLVHRVDYTLENLERLSLAEALVFPNLLMPVNTEKGYYRSRIGDFVVGYKLINNEELETVTIGVW